MRKADFQARVKKIEINNRVLTDGWAQSIRLVLEDIELTNENLLELRQFRPNESVLVKLEPVQLSLDDVNPSNVREFRAPKKKKQTDDDEEEFISFVDEDEDKEKPMEKAVKEWKFK